MSAASPDLAMTLNRYLPHLPETLVTGGFAEGKIPLYSGVAVMHAGPTVFRR